MLPTRRTTARSLGENAHDVSTALDLVAEPLLRVVAPHSAPVSWRNANMRQDFVLGGIKQLRQLRPASADTISRPRARSLPHSEHHATRTRCGSCGDHLLRAVGTSANAFLLNCARQRCQ